MSSNLDLLPGMPPPPGEIPNFINPYSRGKTYTLVATSIIAVMLLLVTNRLYTKYFAIRKVDADDCKLYHPVCDMQNNKALISAQGICLLATVNYTIIEVIREWLLMVYSGEDCKPWVLH
jgi:hypothetical protein